MKIIIQLRKLTQNFQLVSVLSTFLAVGFLVLFSASCKQYVSKNYGVVNNSAEPVVVRIERKFLAEYNSKSLNPDAAKKLAKETEARIRAGEVSTPHIFYGDPQNFSREAEFSQVWKAVEKEDWQFEFDELIISFITEDEYQYDLTYRLVIKVPPGKAAIVEQFMMSSDLFPPSQPCCGQLSFEVDKIIINGYKGELILKDNDIERFFDHDIKATNNAIYHFHNYN